MTDRWSYERAHGWTMRVCKCRGRGYMAEAKVGEFETDNAIYEPGDVYFEFASTPERAKEKLWMEVLSLGAVH